MIAPSIFLNGSFTLRTLVGVFPEYPVFIHLILGFTAGLTIVPRSITCEAYISLAL